MLKKIIYIFLLFQNVLSFIMMNDPTNNYLNGLYNKNKILRSINYDKNQIIA